MRILIFEDESLTAERLIQLLARLNEEIIVLEVINSVGEGVKWFAEYKPLPDLMFMDIQLSDGYCFEIFEKVNIDIPVIFTTAYDEYAIKAFKFNSVDYLLKPIDFRELKAAVDKYHKMRPSNEGALTNTYNDLYNHFRKSYKKRFLVKIGEQLRHVNAENIAYFIHDSGLVNLATTKGDIYFIDYSLDKLEEILDPSEFFRLNRKFIASVSSIGQIHTYFNSRLKIIVIPPYKEDVIVSRERVAAFKDWLNL